MDKKNVDKEILPLKEETNLLPPEIEIKDWINTSSDKSITLSAITELSEEPIYQLMFHGFGTDCLAQISPREKPETDCRKGDIATYTGTNYIFTLEGYSNLKKIKRLRVSTQKLLDVLIMELTRINSKGSKKIQRKVDIDLEKYIGKDISKRNEKKKRRRIREDFKILSSLKLEWKEPNKKQDKGFTGMPIFSFYDYDHINKGWITAIFNDMTVNYLVNSYMMWYPENLLKIDDRNPCAYHIGRYLAIHHSIPDNQKRGTANIISIKALLDANHDIPSEAEVRQSGRHYYQQRIEPLLKALDVLVDVKVLKKCRLCNTKGEPLSKSQQNKKDYRSTLKQYVYFEFADNKKFNQYIEQLKQPKIETKQRRSKKQRKD